MLGKQSRLFKLYRITTWIKKIYQQLLQTFKKITGKLLPEEINNAEIFRLQRTKKIQESREPKQWEEIKQRLKLKEQEDNIMVCRGRIQGEHPNYLPPDHQLTKLVIQEAHERTKHGFMSLTMGEMRQRFWIESHFGSWLNQQSTDVTCARDTDRSPWRGLEQILYQHTGRLLPPVQHQVHLDLAENMNAETFRRSLKEFITRRRNPDMMVSDNAKTFQNTKKWLKKIRQILISTHCLQNGTSNGSSTSPWWGGFFERMVGMSKNIIYKAVGRLELTCNVLKEIVSEAESILNNLSLTYLEDEAEQSPTHLL
ncbi:uncharacterized protein [Clytia hemisphaerica]|uniref:uncharacterized protein n=1 Tax=Clytia hemisphaerica TaxID=252671 RepID=UPI0034D5F978